MENSKEVFVKTEKISAKIEAEKIKDRLHTQKEKRKIVEKLKNVKGLAESDDEEDTSEWYNKMARIQKEKELAKKKAKLLEEMDQEFAKTKTEIKRKEKMYSTKDLKGLAIGHKLDSIKEGQQVILTLRDNDVLKEDEDVLENVNILDEEKAAKNIENKTKKPDYKPYDDDEFDEFGILKKTSLLSKYDEEIEGPVKDLFRIGESKKTNLDTVKMKLEQQGKVSLSLPEFKVASEYYTPDEMIKFKKPSKRKRSLRKKTKIEIHEELASDLKNNSNQNDHGTRSKRQKLKKDDGEVIRTKVKLDINQLNEDDIIGPDEDLSGIRIEEDDAQNELQSALNKARKLKQKENLNHDPALNVAKIIESSKIIKQDDDSMDTLENSSNKNIVLNATAEFCRNLGDLPTFEEPIHVHAEPDIEMKFEEEIPDDMINDDDNKYRNNWNEVDIKMEEIDEEDEQTNEYNEHTSGQFESQPILEEEPDVSVGVAGALKLAMNKGYLDKESGKPVGANRASSIISAKAYTIEEKFYEDDRLGRRERYSGQLSEFKEKDNYRPDFKLDYVDDKGRLMNQKEAFRHLSHKFHGKGPGKNKIDKRMKKLEQDSKLRQMSSIDTPLNTLKLLQEKQKEMQAPYIVLSGQRSTNAPNITQISKKK